MVDCALATLRSRIRAMPLSSPSRSVPTTYLLEWRVLPAVTADRVRVLVSGVPDPQVLDDLSWHFGVDLVVEQVSPEELDTALTRLEHGEMGDTLDFIKAQEEGEAVDGGGEADLTARIREAPVIRLVNALLREALDLRASDVHLESGRNGLEVRYRVDGVLQQASSPPPALSAAIIGRLKVMGELDVAERRRPQDGRVRLHVEGRSVDVRMSTLPTLHGESMVLRLLETQAARHELASLGMAPHLQATWESLLARPNGMLLATGPTGSGKTTTLYGSLETLRTGQEKVVTVEDPVEYALAGVAQVAVNRKAGVTFAAALRSILRQDPDVIFVGEMRDAETTDICIQAALTGHLVLSTLHTNDAPGALVRLVDLGAERYLVASTVMGVLAQRLVRMNCPTCTVTTDLPDAVAVEMKAAGFRATQMARGMGCSDCRGSGYLGRRGVYELLVMNDEIRTSLLLGHGAMQIRAVALQSGMRSLRDDGWRLVASGTTTPEEVIRATQG